MVRIATALISLSLVLCTFSPASAQSVSSLVEGNNNGVVTSDPQGPSSTVVTSSLSFPGSATIDFSQDGFGEAVQRPDGVGAVLVDALFANGQPGNSALAQTTWTETATNLSGVPTAYTFDFLITPASLRIGDFAGLEETDIQRPDVSFLATIRVDGVPVFVAGANLIGGSVSHVLNETGTSLSPTFVGGGTVFGYDFQGFADTLDLGAVAPGASITVEYEMIARVDTPGFEAGGRAQLGDPFDLDGTPGFSGSLTPGGPVSNESSSWGRIKSLYR